MNEETENKGMIHTLDDREELVIDRDKVNILSQYVERIQQLFKVSVECQDGTIVEYDETNMQWIQVIGDCQDDRKLAIEYIKGVCNPQETLEMKYPEEFHDNMARSRDKIEKQSRAVLQFDVPGVVTVQGAERLSVALAFSSLEDVINELVYIEPSGGDSVVDSITSPGKRQGSKLLDEAIQDLQQDDNSIIVIDDDYTMMNDAVKRTLLACVAEDSTSSPAYKRKKQNLGENDLSSLGIRSKAHVGDRTFALGDAVHVQDLESRAPAVKSVGNLGIAIVKLRDIQMETEHSQSVNDAPVKDSTALEKPSSSSMPTIDKVDRSVFLKKMGQSKGYTMPEIETVFKSHGREVEPSVFMRTLLNNRNPKTFSNVESTPSSKALSEIDTDTLVPGSSSPRLSRQEVARETRHMAEYLNIFDEPEEGLGMDELKKRNEERRQQLLVAYQRKNLQATSTEPVTRINTRENIEDQQEFSATDSGYIEHSRSLTQNPATLGKGKNVHQSKRSSPHNIKDKTRFGSPSRESDHNNGRNNHQRFRPKDRPHDKKQNQPHHQVVDYQAGARPKTETDIKSNLRYIVLDGSNVAMAHGNHTVFSCKGIKLAIDFFLKRGHTEVTAFVPQWRTRAPKFDRPISDQHLLEEMQKSRHLTLTPARRVPGKTICCYDDKFVLSLAEQTDGICVSNDNYRDLWQEKNEWREIIEHRLLMFSFVGDIFMPPDDPLGKNGPNLDEFLRKSDPNSAARRIPNPRQGGVPLQQQYRPGNHLASHGSRFQSPPRHQQQPRLSWQQALNLDPNQIGGNFPTDQAPPHSWTRYQNRPPAARLQYPTQESSLTDGVNNHGTATNAQADWYTVQGQNQNSKAVARSPQSTADVKTKLLTVFPDNETQILQLLADHPSETDLNTLSSILMSDLES